MTPKKLRTLSCWLWCLSLIFPCYNAQKEIYFGLSLLLKAIHSSFNLLNYLFQPFAVISMAANILFWIDQRKAYMGRKFLHYHIALYMLLFNLFFIGYISIGGEKGFYSFMHNLLTYPAVYSWLASFFLLYLALKMEQTK